MTQLLAMDSGEISIRSQQADNDELIKLIKFITDSDKTLLARLVPMSKFQSKEDFYRSLIVRKDESENESQLYSSILIRQAFELLGVKISIKLQDEINESNEDEIFNNEMISLYGESADDITDAITNSKKCIIKDLRILSDDSECTLATASRNIWGSSRM